MKKPITVKVLVTVNSMAHFDACTLCFETLRVGWPTAEIHIYVNGGAFMGDIINKLYNFNKNQPDQRLHLFGTKPVHHAEWIRQQIQHSYSSPLVIADPDIVYWKSCEDWEFPAGTLLAGYYNPRMWNDFAQCISVPRIHTSMMVFPDTQKLRTAITIAYPWCRRDCGDYCPCDPFMPVVRFDIGHPIFWDSCANLYNMLLSFENKDKVYFFGDGEKACFDHLNSASFHDAMADRMDTDHSANFLRAHTEWVKNPTPGLWRAVDEYYKQKEIEGWVRHPGDRTLKV